MPGDCSHGLPSAGVEREVPHVFSSSYKDTSPICPDLTFGASLKALSPNTVTSEVRTSTKESGRGNVI